MNVRIQAIDTGYYEGYEKVYGSREQVKSS